MKLLLKISLIVVPLALIGCNQVKMDSNWNDDAVIIDGDLGEWTEGLMVPPETDVAIAVRNDSDYLYLALRTHDQDVIRQVVMTGFTLWLDPDGGRNKGLGIGYPQPGRNERPQMQIQQRNLDPATQFDMLQKSLLTRTEVMITDENERVSRLDNRSTGGIQVAVSLGNGMLQYELQVPLTDDWHNRLALAVESGASIGVGLTTPKIDRPERPGGRSGGGMSGGMPGGGGRGGGGGGRGAGMGGKAGGGRGQHPEGMPLQSFDPMKLWLKVKLSEK
jgi:hypothetical protein